MRFGIALESFSPPGRNPDVNEIYRSTQVAESLGFDSAWAWDHLLLGSRKVFPVLDAPTLLAAIGARTTRLKLGTSVLVIAHRNPVVLAKVLSTIQYVCGGRLIVGAGVGWYEKEFRATGIDYSKRGAIFERRFQLIKKLLNESDINYSEEGFVLEHTTMEPRPKERVPLLMGGYSDRVFERAGKMADGWIGYYYTAEGFKEAMSKVESSARKCGRDPASLRRVNIVPLCIAKDYETSDRIAHEFTNKYMDLPKNTPCTVESSIRGTVSECKEQIRKYEDAGVEDLVFIPANYDIELIEKAGKEIIPSFI